MQNQYQECCELRSSHIRKLATMSSNKVSQKTSVLAKNSETYLMPASLHGGKVWISTIGLCCQDAVPFIEVTGNLPVKSEYIVPSPLVVR